MIYQRVLKAETNFRYTKLFWRPPAGGGGGRCTKPRPGFDTPTVLQSGGGGGGFQWGQFRGENVVFQLGAAIFPMEFFVQFGVLSAPCASSLAAVSQCQIGPKQSAVAFAQCATQTKTCTKDVIDIGSTKVYAYVYVSPDVLVCLVGGRRVWSTIHPQS